MVQTRKWTVLVVDDERHVRQYLQMVLQDAGFAVLTAADGLEGLKIVREKRPDFVSVDLAMPRMTGRRMLVEMRKDPALARIPVVIVTAHARDALGARTLAELTQAGYLGSPDGYLEKPVAASKYLEVVERALGIDETDEQGALGRLRAELRSRIADAGPEVLMRALDVLSEEVDGDQH